MVGNGIDFPAGSCKMQVYPRDITGSVPDNCHKATLTVKPVTQIVWFPSAYKSYVYTIVY